VKLKMAALIAKVQSSILFCSEGALNLNIVQISILRQVWFIWTRFSWKWDCQVSI